MLGREALLTDRLGRSSKRKKSIIHFVIFNLEIRVCHFQFENLSLFMLWRLKVVACVNFKLIEESFLKR